MKKVKKVESWKGYELESIKLGAIKGKGATNGHTYVSKEGGGEFDDCAHHDAAQE